jgi:hypothetical protein
MRDNWTGESNYLLIDCGPHGEATCGYAHAHADALALIELAVRGRTVLVDPGTYAYTSSIEARDWFRSTAAHNSLTIDGEPSSAPGGPFAWRQIAEVTPRAWVSREHFDFFEGVQRGFAQLHTPATHTRSVLFLKGDYWVVRDRVETEGTHRYDLHFHFVPGATPDIKNDGESMSVGEQQGNVPVIQLFAFGDRGQWRGGEGWVSPCYGERIKAPTFTFSAEAQQGPEFVTFIVPRAAHQPEIRARRLEVETRGHAFELMDGEHQDLLALSDGEHIEASGLLSDFAWALLRTLRDTNEVSEILALGGRLLRFNGVELFKAAERVGYVSARLNGDELIVETDARGGFKMAGMGAERVHVNGESFAVNGALHLHFIDGHLADPATEGVAAGVLV